MLKKEFFYLDQLRALAIIAVVLIHISLVYLVSTRIDILALIGWFQMFFIHCVGFVFQYS